MKSMRSWNGQVSKFKSEMLKPIILAKPKKPKEPTRDEHEVANVKSLHQALKGYKQYSKKGEQQGNKYLKTFSKIGGDKNGNKMP